MTRRVDLTADAEADIDEAAQWYERRSAGLGVDFVSRVRTTLGLVGSNPEIYGIVYSGLRRAAVKRFPYRVFFRLRDDRVEVVAVMHDRRDPSVWQSRA